MGSWAPGASPADRLEMARLCFATFSREEVEVDPFEIQRAGAGPTYTYDSLVELGGRYRNLAFVVGSDQLPAMEGWNRFPEILRLCDWIVLERKPDGASVARGTLKDWEGRGWVRPVPGDPGAWETPGTTRIGFFATKAREASSTSLKASLETPGGEAGATLSAMPHEIRTYIRKRGLYGHSRGRAP